MLCVLQGSAVQAGSWKKVNGKWQAEELPVQSLSARRKENQEKLDDLLKLYGGWKKKKKKKEAVVEWVDNSFIKDYTTHEQMLDQLDTLEKEFPSLIKRYAIGRSEEGRELAAVRVSATGSVKGSRPALVPMVKYVANIHGDETVGRELLLGLARYLTAEYGKNERITKLLDTTDLHLAPSLNPDGYCSLTRNNSRDEDLNRNYPGWRDIDKTRNELFENRETETAATMRWILDNPFVLSLSFHDGRVLVNYPWDDSPAAVEGEKAICPDDQMFSRLSSLYANNHPFMWTGKCLCHSEIFTQGISNGAEWYVVDNGMQDFNYLFTNCLELTVELSCAKKPPTQFLSVEWENNLDSLLLLLEAAHTGVKGIVRDQDGKTVTGAVVYFGAEKEVKTTSNGEFWKLLMPGKYNIYAFHENNYGVLESEVQTVEVTNAIGCGAIICDVVVRLKVPEVFHVNTAKVGYMLEDLSFKDEVTQLFEDASVQRAVVLKQQCKNMKENSRHIVFKVEMTFHPLPMFHFFKERWAEEMVRRPQTEFEAKKLKRRLKLYAQDKWCGRKNDWNMKLLSDLEHA